MRATFYVLCLMILFLQACNEKTTENNTKDTVTASVSSGRDVKQCYAYITAKDTIMLSMSIDGNGGVKGNLSYNIYQKDKNVGHIQGYMQGDTLIADYTFASEGTTSVRQVVFLRKEHTMVEGIGNIIEKEGKMSFEDVKAVNFNQGLVFREMPCKE